MFVYPEIGHQFLDICPIDRYALFRKENDLPYHENSNFKKIKIFRRKQHPKHYFGEYQQPFQHFPKNQPAAKIDKFRLRRPLFVHMGQGETLLEMMVNYNSQARRMHVN
jgi:hypothetical protein